MDELGHESPESFGSGQPGPKKPHWSKDYVEHLRAVHFALVTICVVLILLSLSQGKNEVELARDQNRQIQDLLRDFSPAWFKAQAPVAVHDLQSREDRLSSLPFPKLTLRPETANAIEIDYDLAARLLLLPPPDGQPTPGSSRKITIPLVMDNDNWVLSTSSSSPLQGEKYAEDPSIKLPQELSGIPHTLQAFHDLWDNLGDDKHLEVAVPEELAEEGYLKMPNEALIVPMRVSFVHSDDSKGILMSPRHWMKPELDFGRLKFDRQSDVVYAGEWYIPGGTELDRRLGFTIVLPVKTYARIPFDGQAALIRHSANGWQWHRGPFKDAFQQLAKVVKDYEALPPQTINEILDSEMQRSGESFEAIGLKVPAEDVVRFGILLIIGVQLYLWVHLYEKATQWHEADEGLEVAWIGVYRSRYAKAMMFLTTCLLPAFASLSLGFRGLRISSFYLHWSSAPYWSILVAGTLVAFILGFLTWNRLLRLSESTRSNLIDPT